MDDSDKKMLTEVHSAVIGNEQLGHEGLVKKVDRHEKWINSANLKAAGFIGGVAVIIWLLDHFLKS